MPNLYLEIFSTASVHIAEVLSPEQNSSFNNDHALRLAILFSLLALIDIAHHISASVIPTISFNISGCRIFEMLSAVELCFVKLLLLNMSL